MFKRSFILILVIAVLFISCDVTRNNTLNKTKIPELRLVSIGSNVFNKTSPSTEADINFGDIISTEKLYYLIENTGDIPVFNVSLLTSKDSIEIKPSTIGVINPQGSEISATPIISMICPHVIPTSGVGSLLDMSLGEFIDSLSLNYQFIAPFDSTKAWEEGDTIFGQTEMYSVSGNKKGVILEPHFNGVPVWDSPEIYGFGYSTSDEGVVFFNSNLPKNSTNYSLFNKGNCPIDYKMEIRIKRKVPDTFFTERDTLYFSGTLLANDFIGSDTLNKAIEDYPYSGSDELSYTLIITFSPTPYIINLYDRNFINGFCEINFVLSE